MPGLRLTLLDEVARDYLHDKTLEVLESVGAQFESSRARELLRQGGCQVDDETEIVRMPRELVEQTIGSFIREVLLAARDPQQDALLDGSRTYMTTAGICPYVVDRETGVQREPTLQDLADIGRVADALDEVGLLWFAVSPTADAPGTSTDLASLACLLSSTGKHIQGQLVRPEDVPVALELLRTAAPGTDLKARPIFSSIYCPVAPLKHEAAASEAGMAMAAAGIPIDIFSLALSGATAPMSLAGTVVQTMADELSAAVLFKLVAPDCPLLLSSNSGIMDMRTSRFATSTPETILMSVAETEMVRSYGVPSLSVGHVSDAPSPGFRGGLESMAQALPIRLARPDVMIGLGTVEAGQAIHLEKLVLDAEVVRHNDRLLEGLAVDAEHAAVEIIAAVGPGGHFLERKETRRLLRSGEHWIPRLLERSVSTEQSRLMHPSGAEAPAPAEASAPPRSEAGELAAARALVDELLRSHEPLPLPEGAAAQFKRSLGVAMDRT